MVLLMVSAVYTDLKFRKVYDKITVPMMLSGLIIGGIAAGLSGVKAAAIGLGVALAIYIVPCELAWIGGGDAKLMIALGSLEGYRFVLVTTLLGSILGFFQSLWLLAKRPGGFSAFFKSLISGSLFYSSYKDRKREENVPLGVYLGIGGILALFCRSYGIF